MGKNNTTKSSSKIESHIHNKIIIGEVPSKKKKRKTKPRAKKIIPNKSNPFNPVSDNYTMSIGQATLRPSFFNGQSQSQSQAQSIQQPSNPFSRGQPMFSASAYNSRPLIQPKEQIKEKENVVKATVEPVETIVEPVVEPVVEESVERIVKKQPSNTPNSALKLSRKEIQKLAKEHGISGRLSNDTILESIKELYGEGNPDIVTAKVYDDEKYEEVFEKPKPIAKLYKNDFFEKEKNSNFDGIPLLPPEIKVEHIKEYNDFYEKEKNRDYRNRNLFDGQSAETDVTPDLYFGDASATPNNDNDNNDNNNDNNKKQRAMQTSTTEYATYPPLSFLASPDKKQRAMETSTSSYATYPQLSFLASPDKKQRAMETSTSQYATYPQLSFLESPDKKQRAIDSSHVYASQLDSMAEVNMKVKPKKPPKPPKPSKKKTRLIITNEDEFEL